MSADISITITADPSQAVRGIEQVQGAAQKLAVESRKVAESSAGDNTQAINQVLTVSRAAQQAVNQTGTAVGSVSTGIKQAASEAAKMSGAFGAAVPLVGRLGSAIASAITGPVGAISAAIGLAIAGINKMIADAEERVERLRASASTRASSAYDRLMQGRTQYAADLKTLEQVREINSAARQTPLSSAELAQFRQLAEQIGIAARDVTATGIRSGRIDEAERNLNQQRRFYANQDYNNYIEAMGNHLSRAIESSKLDDAMKLKLAQMGTLGAADKITLRAQMGAGDTMEEYKAWQDLYAIVKPLAEVRTSFNRDAMLGRSQADLNAQFAASVTQSRAQSVHGGDSGFSGAPEPGTWAWQKEQDRLAMKAAEEKKKEEARRSDAARRLTEGLEHEIEYQRLATSGRQREAEILRQRVSMEAALGRQLTASEQASIEHLAGTLYDLRHPQEPDLAPLDPGTADSPVRVRAVRASASVPLDSLQRIGANVVNPAASPERMLIERQTSMQQDIRTDVNRIANSMNNQSTGMKF